MSDILTITIHDDDRSAAPDLPYAAVVTDGTLDFDSSGIGATPADALADLVSELRMAQEREAAHDEDARLIRKYDGP